MLLEIKYALIYLRNFPASLSHLCFLRNFRVIRISYVAFEGQVAPLTLYGVGDLSSPTDTRGYLAYLPTIASRPHNTWPLLVHKLMNFLWHLT